eukprot:gene7448-8270_t
MPKTYSLHHKEKVNKQDQKKKSAATYSSRPFSISLMDMTTDPQHTFFVLYGSSMDENGNSFRTPSASEAESESSKEIPSPGTFKRSITFLKKEESVEKYPMKRAVSEETPKHSKGIEELPVISIHDLDSNGTEEMNQDVFLGESEEDAEMRREAFQCMRSSRGTRSEPLPKPDSNVRTDLQALYLEATGHNRLSESESQEKKTPWNFLRSKFGGKKMSLLDGLRELLEQLGDCRQDFAEHDLASYRELHWTDVFKSKFGDSSLKSISEKECKRFEALWELFYAEVVYIIDHLTVLKEVFKIPAEISKKLGFLEQVSPLIVFGNLERLIQVSTRFANSLLNMFKVDSLAQFGNSQAIVQAFQQFNMSLHPEYHQYCINYSAARRHLMALSNDIEFKEFNKWSEADKRCKRLHLNDLLVAPVQHLTKYPLLLKVIKNNTSKSSCEFDPLNHVITAVQKSIREIEGELHVLSNLERIQDIGFNIIWPSLIDSDNKAFIPEFLRTELGSNCDLFANPWRILIKEGYITLTEHSKSEIYLILFDDLILMTKHRRSSSTHGKSFKRRNTHLGESPATPDVNYSRRIKGQQSLKDDQPPQSYTVFKQPLPLDRVKLYDCEDHLNSGSAYKHSFVLIHQNRFGQNLAIYTLQASGTKEKNIWVQRIRKAQKDYISLNPRQDFCSISENNNGLTTSSYSIKSSIERDWRMEASEKSTTTGEACKKEEIPSEDFEEEMEQLRFEPKNIKRRNSLTKTMECLLCSKTFQATENGQKNPILSHLLKDHKVVISDVQFIADFPCYISYWKKRLSEEEFTNIFAVIKTNTGKSDKAPSEDYFLLSEFLPEDRVLRERLKEERIAGILKEQESERSNPSFNRKCLFCKQQFKVHRHLLFEHMIKEHGFNIGNPDNIVHVNDMLDSLAKKLDSLCCIFCGKEFKDWGTLREHMRKKNHKRIDPKDKSYDKYYLINYLEPGKDWEVLQAEEEEEVEKAEEEWSGWDDHLYSSFMCLFCELSYQNVDNILIHMREEHDFDIKTVKDKLGLDFYMQVKVVNYIRRQIQELKCPRCKDKQTSKAALDEHMNDKRHCCLPDDKAFWDQPEYFFPTIENDGLLCFLDDEDNDANDDNGEQGDMNENAKCTDKVIPGDVPCVNR